jgi:EAL domain-containing protein (putative c-di-GMP-specific phosphodiesterase class I)
MFEGLDLLDEAPVSLIDSAIADNRITFAVHGIGSVSDPDEVLYGECLARLIEADGTVRVARDFVPYLEGLGATPSLDRHMLRLVLDELEADPRAVLGSNLSADNLASPEVWAGIYDQIAARPHLASRLILEVTETRPLASLALAGGLLSKARDLGCRIAVDDFGSGYATPSRLLALDADIVKIDVLFIQDLRSRHDGYDSLYHMVGLAACVAPVTVVEGVETAGQLQAAKAAGASHVQGFLLSQPVFHPEWKNERAQALKGKA